MTFVTPASDYVLFSIIFMISMAAPGLTTPIEGRSVSCMETGPRAARPTTRKRRQLGVTKKS